MSGARRLGAAAILAIAAASGLHAEGSPPLTASITVSALNRYIFRGYRFGLGGLVLQPYVTVSYAGFSGSLWGNFDTGEGATPNFTPDRAGRSSYNETDVSANYAFGAGPFSLSAGFVYYGTRYTARTFELFATAALNVFGTPTLAVNRDIDAFPGTYVNLSWSPSVSLADGVSLDLAAAAGFYAGGSSYWRTFDPATGGYTGAPYRAFHDGSLKAALTIGLGRGWKLQPLVQYVFPLSSAARRPADAPGGTANGPLAPVVVVGAAVLYSF